MLLFMYAAFGLFEVKRNNEKNNDDENVKDLGVSTWTSSIQGNQAKVSMDTFDMYEDVYVDNYHYVEERGDMMFMVTMMM